MKRNLFLFVIFATGMSSLADPSVMEDLKELLRLGQETILKEDRPPVDLIKIWDRQAELQARVEPILKRVFSTLADGELSPLARDLLENLETLDYYFCLSVLRTLLDTYPVDIQTKVLEKVFGTVPDSLQGRIILSFLSGLPREAFSGKEIQQWLVGAINGGMPGGAFYFVLTDESAKAVSKTAAADMRQFSKANNWGYNLFPLISIIFLASQGDDEALKILDSSLEQVDFDSIDTILAAAMSGNEKLIKKILNIVTTDKRTRFHGYDCVPQESSFAHEAARACALAIEGFPAVVYYKYDDETKEKVHKWIKDNPIYTVKQLDSRRVFLKETRLRVIFPSMSRALEKK